jgi:ABC-type multidrug transport system fused ATPase/permease subunit
MEALFAGHLPRDVLARSSKASFDEAFFHRHGRAFAASWDGAGLPEDVVDVTALSREWRSGAPAPQSLSLLQVAWLARESGRVGPVVGVMHVPAIEVDELRRSFGAIEALRGISLEVGSGEIHAVLGPNGAGKTTLMRTLCGLVDPSAGSAYVMDRRAGGSPSRRESIGLVPSGDRSFYLRLSGFENLVFFARLNGMRRREARVRAAEVLEAVGPDRRGPAPHEHLLARHAEAPVVRPRAAARPRRPAGGRGDPRPRSRRRRPGPRL